MKNIFLVLMFLPFLFSCQTENTISSYSKFVGDINFDEKVDDPEFKKCGIHQDFSFQYYHENGFQFSGEKYRILEELSSKNIYSTENFDGYIIIKFIVNCEGKAGMFRVQQMNMNYQKMEGNHQMIKKLLDFTKSLTGWLPKEYRGEKVDYYQYLTYKIKDGKITEILP